MTRRGRRLRALALVAVASITAATPACGVFGGSGTVVLFGDSLTVLVMKDVTNGAKPDIDVTTKGTWGLRIDELIDPAAEVAATDPDQVVVNLGTNNVLQRRDIVASNQDLDRLVEELSDVRCIHLVTVNEQIHHLGGDFTKEARALNDEIRRLAARRLNTTVIDWNQMVLDHAGDNIMDADTVHPNPAGITLLAAAYLEAIRAC